MTGHGQVTAPALVLTLDLDGDLPALPPSVHTSALALIRRGRRPIAEVALRLRDPLTPQIAAGPGLSAAGLRAAVDRALRGLPERAPDEGTPRPSSGELTVVVTTCGNPDELARCVDSILASAGCRPRIVVVDNRPGDPRTRRLIAERYAGEGRVRLLAEPRRGLSWARNAGIAAADTEFVAWTDDDVVVDPHWAQMLCEAFTVALDVDLVTGLVRPLELETPAQVWREVNRGYSKGLSRRVWTMAHPPADVPLFPYATGRIGTGANMAGRRERLLALGGFDTRLGAGTPAAGGEDLDLVLRVLEAGSTVVYEPAGIVAHRHHAQFDDLLAQARDYGIGLSSYLMTVLFSHPRRIGGIARRAPAALRHLAELRRAGAAADGADPVLAHRMRRAETLGLLTGVGRDLRHRAGRLVPAPLVPARFARDRSDGRRGTAPLLARGSRTA